jgi:hypothetical protein
MISAKSTGFLAEDTDTSESEDKAAQGLQEALKRRRQKLATTELGIAPESEPDIHN